MNGRGLTERNGRKRKGRNLMRTTGSVVQVERVYPDEKIGFAARPRHLLLDWPVVVRLVDQGHNSAAGCTRLLAGGTPLVDRFLIGLLFKLSSASTNRK